MVDRKKPQWSWVNRIISESVNICQSAPLGGIHDVKLSSFCPRENLTTLSPPCVPAHLRPLIKLAGNLIRNYSLKRKFCCPEQIIKCCEGAKATFIRAQKREGGRSEDLRRGCRLIYIFSFTFSPELGKRLVSLDTEEKPLLWKKNQHVLWN